jgi:hypothetical protein
MKNEEIEEVAEMAREFLSNSSLLLLITWIMLRKNR